MNLQNMFENLKQGFSKDGLEFKTFNSYFTFEFEKANEADIAQSASTTFQQQNYTTYAEDGYVWVKEGKRIAFLLTITCLREGGGGLATITQLR